MCFSSLSLLKCIHLAQSFGLVCTKHLRYVSRHCTTAKRPIAANAFPMYERPSVVVSAYRWRVKFCSSAVGRPVVSATCTTDAENKNTLLVHGAGRAEKSHDRGAYPNVTGIRSLVTQCKISPSVVLPQKTSDMLFLSSLSLVFGVLFTGSKFSRRLVQMFTGDKRVFFLVTT